MFYIRIIPTYIYCSYLIWNEFKLEIIGTLMKLKDHQQQKFAKYDLVSLSYFEGQVNCYYVKHCIFWQKTCSSIKKLFFKHSL